MSSNLSYSLRFLVALILSVMIRLEGLRVYAQACPEPVPYTLPVFTVDAQHALYSLMTISDAHLQKVADVFTTLAMTDDIQSARWERIREPLSRAARMNVAGVYWFALPDGSYWTLDSGRVTANLASRPYFPRLLAGQTVLGDLVVSRSTGRNTAIVAVPVYRKDKKLAGALGCSIHLDSLSARIKQELGGLEANLLFYAVDSKPMVALNSNPALIFLEPLSLEEEGIQEAIRTMLASREGVVRYTFRGVRRVVLYHKSNSTNWWYAFGKVEP